MSHASGIAVEICKPKNSDTEDIGSRNKDNKSTSFDEEDSNQVSLLMEDEQKEQHNM